MQVQVDLDTEIANFINNGGSIEKCPPGKASEIPCVETAPNRHERREAKKVSKRFVDHLNGVGTDCWCDECVSWSAQVDWMMKAREVLGFPTLPTSPEQWGLEMCLGFPFDHITKDWFEVSFALWRKGVHEKWNARINLFMEQRWGVPLPTVVVARGGQIESRTVASI